MYTVSVPNLELATFWLVKPPCPRSRTCSFEATTALPTLARKNIKTARRTADSQGSACHFDRLCHSVLILES